MLLAGSVCMHVVNPPYCLNNVPFEWHQNYCCFDLRSFFLLVWSAFSSLKLAISVLFTSASPFGDHMRVSACRAVKPRPPGCTERHLMFQIQHAASSGPQQQIRQVWSRLDERFSRYVNNIHTDRQTDFCFIVEISGQWQNLSEVSQPYSLQPSSSLSITSSKPSPPSQILTNKYSIKCVPNYKDKTTWLHGRLSSLVGLVVWRT